MVKSFILGAAGYPLLEMLYRGRTHYSMAIAGGISVCLIRQIQRTRYSLYTKSILCGLGITAVELLCGSIWNRRYTVWDYRRTPLNYKGQICLPYSLLWCGLSAAFLAGDYYIKKLTRVLRLPATFMNDHVLHPALAFSQSNRRSFH